VGGSQLVQRGSPKELSAPQLDFKNGKEDRTKGGKKAKEK